VSTEPRRVTVIAEAAQGYEGDPTVARLLVRAAAAAQADAIKFQLVYADELATAQYQHYGLFKALEMPAAAWQAVAAEARRLGIALLFDVFGERSLAEAGALGAAGVKIHATDFFNDALTAAATRDAAHVYFSAGGIHVDEVARFLASRAADRGKYTFLYGFQAEPTATADNHLSRLRGFRSRFPDLALGFMDHAHGDDDEAAWLGVLALPYGVSAIEKHLTLNRSLALEDSVSALAPEAFARYVARVRAAESALGSDDLALSEAESKYRHRALKVVVARRPLAAGHSLAAADVTLLRAPLDAAREPVHELPLAIGRILKNAVGADQPVYRDDIS